MIFPPDIAPLPRIDARQVKDALRGREAEIISSYRGVPNQRQSGRRDMRWGNHGSLSLHVQRGLWFDHELGRGGDILEFLKLENGVRFPEALDIAASIAGISGGGSVPVRREAPLTPPEPEDAPDELERMDKALDIWADVVPLKGTIAEKYLASRGLTLPDEAIPEVGFHPQCPWGPGDRRPAMVAQLRDIPTGDPLGIHRTALNTDGSKIGRKALGLKSDTAVKLWPEAQITDDLSIAEGIETTLAGTALGLKPAWSVIDANGIRDFPVLRRIKRLTILVDNDASGTGRAAAEECTATWEAAGKVVRTFMPEEPGTDFNDYLRAGGTFP